jgi:hypothetical protein
MHTHTHSFCEPNSQTKWQAQEAVWTLKGFQDRYVHVISDLCVYSCIRFVSILILVLCLFCLYKIVYLDLKRFPGSVRACDISFMSVLSRPTWNSDSWQDTHCKWNVTLVSVLSKPTWNSDSWQDIHGKWNVTLVSVLPVGKRLFAFRMAYTFMFICYVSRANMQRGFPCDF